MLTGGASSPLTTTTTTVDNAVPISECSCQYKVGAVPAVTELSNYARRSPPKFYLTNMAKSIALGLISTDCDERWIGLEAQHKEQSLRQQFYYADNRQIVSAACPNKVLVLSCGPGHLTFVNSPANFGNARWNFQQGSIAVDPCPEKSIAAIKATSPVFRSFFFNAIQPRSGMAMTTRGDSAPIGQEILDSVAMNLSNDISLQKPTPGDPSQLFFTEEGKIVSLRYPSLTLFRRCCNRIGSRSSSVNIEQQGRCKQMVGEHGHVDQKSSLS